MAGKNFAIAFQIAAAFTGNSVFTAASQKIAELNAKYRQCGQQLKALNADYRNGAISAAKFIAEQKKIGDLMQANRSALRQQQTLAGAQSRFENNFNAMAKYGANMYQFAEMTKGIASIANTAMSFEEKMSKVKAITHGTAEDMAQLEDEALTLGKTTKFSATEAADAMSFLGMAGWKTQQILDGMPGLLSLAAAGGTDLARTADIVSDDLTAFGLSAESAAHMADVFATVITSTNTNVEMLGETMKYAAPVASAFGASMEETSAMAGMMANAGIKASQAGTALRAGFLRLAGPPKKAANEMAELGIDMSDMAKGQAEAAEGLKNLGIEMDAIPDDGNKMAVIIQKIADATAGMGQQEKLAALQAIFGTTAASGWLAVINQGPEALRELTSKLYNCDGAAKEMADTMTDNASGRIIMFKSALESLKIALGKTLIPALGQTAHYAAVLAEKLGDFANNHPVIVGACLNTALAIAALGTAGNAAMWGINGLKVVTSGLNVVLTRLKITQAAAGLQSLGAIAATRLAPLGAMLSRFGAVLLGPFTMLGAKIAAMAPALGSVGTALGGVAAAALPVVLAIGAVVAVGYLLYKNWETIKEVASVVADKISAAWSQLVERLQPAFDKINSCLNLLGLNGETASTIINTAGSVITAVFMALMAVVEFVVDEFATLIESGTKIFLNFSNFISNVFAGNWSDAWDNIKNIAKSVIDFITGTFGNMITAISNGIDTILGKGGSIKSNAPILAGGGPGPEDIPHNAAGGIYNKGAFLTTFAEDSAEAAIPLDGSPRAVSLWQQAGEMLGQRSAGGSEYNISIPITVNGGADSGTVQNIAGQVEAAVRRALANIEHENRRVSLA